MEQFDVVILGAGMVGAASACALAKQGFSVAIVEANPPKAFSPEQPLDLRVSAISAASERLLAELGAWQHIQAMRSAPYQTLATWEWQSSEVRFDACELGYSHLGHIIENRVVQLGLWQAMAEHSNITLLVGDAPSEIGQDQQQAWLQVGERRLSGKLLLGCDGAESRVRAAANIGLTGWQYRQHCFAINIRTEAAQQAITWQEFTPTGPRAFLPLSGHHGSLVWYDSPETIAALKRLTTAELKVEILRAFPARLAELGEFEIEHSASFALTRRHAQRYFANRMVLLGDAAHTINPLAGQGVNLGFKDVAMLVQVLSKAKQQQQDWSAALVLQQYEKARRRDNLLMQSAMDFFYILFSNDKTPLKLIRNLGLTAAQQSGPIKNKVMQYAMGL